MNKEEVYKRILSEGIHCPAKYGFEGLDTFPSCGACLVCEARDYFHLGDYDEYEENNGKAHKSSSK